MSEFQYQSHDDFDFYVTCGDLTKPRKQLATTLSNRNCASQLIQEDSIIYIDTDSIDEEPFFFENRQYFFEIVFDLTKEEQNTFKAEVTHKHKLVEQSFSYSPRTKALRASINFGNDIGQCKFNVNYMKNGVQNSVPIQFHVFATKMDSSTDLEFMNNVIDAEYPMWRYAIANKTTQSQSKSKKLPEKFELFWLAQFEQLVGEFNQGLTHILHAPHNRLQSFSTQQKLGRINKKLTSKQEEKAKSLLADKRLNSRILIETKRLNLDTPENRFIKMVVNQVKTNLAKIVHTIKQDQQVKLSDSFCNTLVEWSSQIAKFSKHKLWQEIGNYDGLGDQSKVLHQGSGYSKIYKVWQQLKFYLNTPKGEAELAMKSVADIYEIWCFIEVKKVIEELGFVAIESKRKQLKKVQFEKHFGKNELAAAFKYQRADGVKIALAHEPSFTPNGSVNRTWLANQRPDIVLRVTLANEESFLIFFDAKYRIDSSSEDHGDRVPEDAINQMHRYRDAIYHQKKFDHEKPLKSRPVMGAFALYPGYFDQSSEKNYYDDAIKEIGIGAFALLPSSDSNMNHNIWLTQYLSQKLGHFDASQQGSKTVNNDYYFVEDSTRITSHGSNSVRHHGLTMVVPINEIERESVYLDNARQGSLKGYHTHLVATNRQKVHRNIIREIRYLVITVRNSDIENEQLGQYLYRVKNVKLLPRNEIDISLTGKSSNESSKYWLFEFIGEPTPLSSAIVKPYQESFEFKLTKAEHLNKFKHWHDINSEYLLYSELA